MSLPQPAHDAFATLLSGRFSTSLAERELHAGSETFHRSPPPDAVLWPESTSEVSTILKICHEHGVPVIGRGAGTSLEGHALAIHGGICLDLTRMNRVVEILPEDMLAIVQPGLTREELNTELRATGLFFPVDPGANASLGGMAATRASGTTAVHYGTMRRNVRALEVVLADGTIIRTGSRAVKSAAGYDLTGLMVGSEGTLGIITELTLQLYGQPEDTAAGICAFPSLEQAVDCVTTTMASGIPVNRIEFLNDHAVRVFNEQSGTDWPEHPHLMVEFTGSPASVKAAAEGFGALTEDFGGEGFQWATSPDERNALWEMRHGAFWAALRSRPGSVGLSTDSCVPVSRLAEAVAHTTELLEKAGLASTIVGHVGDGNFHALILIDPDNPEELARAKTTAHEISRNAIRLGGTISGEHGIGIGKRDLMVEQNGAEAIATMRAIKQALDPKNILNPGKLLPDPA